MDLYHRFFLQFNQQIAVNIIFEVEYEGEIWN